MRSHSLPDRIRAAVDAFRDPSPAATLSVNVPDNVTDDVVDRISADLADEFEDAAANLRHRHRSTRPDTHEYDGPIPQDVAADLSDRITESIDHIPDDALIKSLRIDAPNQTVVEWVEADPVEPTGGGE